MLYQLSYFRNLSAFSSLLINCFPIADAKVVLFLILPKLSVTFYSLFSSLFTKSFIINAKVKAHFFDTDDRENRL